MRRILTMRWIKGASARDLAAQLSRGRRVKESHVLAVLARPDGASFTALVSELKHVPASTLTQYLDQGVRAPRELLRSAHLSDPCLARVLDGARTSDLEALVTNLHLSTEQLLGVCEEAFAREDQGLQGAFAAHLTWHPSLGPGVVSLMLEHLGPWSAEVLQWRPVELDRGGAPWVEPLTHLWSGDASESVLKKVLTKDHVKPREGMSPWFLKDRHPGFLTKTCVKAGLDPEVALVLADGWSGSTEDFLDACTELGPDALA